MDINEATAKALQAARAVSGLTFEELSAKSGVPAQTVYRMFGAKRDIKLPQLYSLAQAMGITVVELMEDAERIQQRAQRNENAATVIDDVPIDAIAANPEAFGVAANRDSNKDLEHDTPRD